MFDIVNTFEESIETKNAQQTAKMRRFSVFKNGEKMTKRIK